MPAQGRGGPSKRPVSVDAFVVDDSGAPEPPRQCPASVTHQCDVSATLKPMRRTDMCTEKEYKPKATEACVAAVKSMHDTLFPAWAQRTDPPILVFGLSVLEIGDKKKGAHLQTGVTVRLDETVPAKVEKRVTDYFASLLAPFTAGGYIKWQLRKVHIHTDPRFMYGYCYKTHVLHVSLTTLKMAVYGSCLTSAYLKDAYKYYLSKASANEQGDGYLKLSRPGQMTDVPTMTRASMLPDWEYFEYTHGFGPHPASRPAPARPPPAAFAVDDCAWHGAARHPLARLRPRHRLQRRPRTPRLGSRRARDPLLRRVALDRDGRDWHRPLQRLWALIRGRAPIRRDRGLLWPASLPQLRVPRAGLCIWLGRLARSPFAAQGVASRPEISQTVHWHLGRVGYRGRVLDRVWQDRL